MLTPYRELRANPLLRVKVKFTATTIVCRCPRPLHTAFLTVNLTLTRTSGAALREFVSDTNEGKAKKSTRSQNTTKTSSRDVGQYLKNAVGLVERDCSIWRESRQANRKACLTGELVNGCVIAPGASNPTDSPTRRVHHQEAPR